MSLMKALVVAAAVAVTASAPLVLAQQPQHQHDDKQPPAAAAKPGMAGHGMDDAHMAQHMAMCRQMMGQGGMMGGTTGRGGMGRMMGGDAQQPAYDTMTINGKAYPATKPLRVRTGER